MSEMTKGELLKFIINNFDSVNGVFKKDPNPLGIAKIKIFYDTKKVGGKNEQNKSFKQD